MTLKVAFVVPDRQLWSGEARMVIAKTTEGDLGVLTGHAPVFGALADGSTVEILDPDGEGNAPIWAAVNGGFLSVDGSQVSILAAEAVFASEVDTTWAQEAAGSHDDAASAKYAQAQLRARDQA
ncbi:MAG TPA: F0F1 ATP synthase subunit epsilon [Streptosporangiaceae bacterium]|nr:F0F1 ATP synthase subunit epsilon [Streptosporangiaceae bacterium]